MAPTGLTVERLVNPIHIWTPSPRFGWLLPAGSPAQSAYELELTNIDLGERVAATGRVTSPSSHSVTVPGLELASRTRYQWRVRVWVGGEEPSEWASASFETTIFAASEWRGSWVEPRQEPVTEEPELNLIDHTAVGGSAPSVEDRLHPSPLMRQSFVLSRVPERARLYITARGIYEVTVNGHGITDEILAPGYDEYQKRLSFQKYDATAALREGENVVGVRLADGWWSGRISFLGTSNNYGDKLAALWQLEGDGQILAASDATARSTSSEIRYADIFIGEKQDSRAQVAGWDEPGFDDASWDRAELSADADLQQLVPSIGEPVRRVLEIKDPQILQTPAGELIIDLGQNIAGRVRLTAEGDEGTTIVLEHTEALDRDGNFQQNIMGRNKDQRDVWVLSGAGRETWEPRFTYHGFRYVRVTGYPGELRPEDVVGVVIASDVPQTGRLITDDARINRLHQNVVWSQRGNFVSIPTDCPQRERAGWTGDVLVFARASTNNAQVGLFFDRWLANLRAAQGVNGVVPLIVPSTPSFADAMSSIGATTSSGWGDVIIDLPLALYERYGDASVLRENYDAMKKWMAWVKEQAETQVLEQYQNLPKDDPAAKRQKLLWNTGHHFGDWLVPSTVTDDNTSMQVAAQLTGALIGSAYYAHSTRSLARIADIVGDRQAAIEMAAHADEIREAFIEEFVDAEGHLSVDMQGVYVIALAFDLIPADKRDAAGARLVQLIRDADDHLDTGFLSVPHLLPVLTAIGERELAYKLLFQDSVPSWLYEVDMGATTIWESWAGVAPDGQPRVLSLNHYAFGAVDDWLFSHVAGVTPNSPGYSDINFTPDLKSPFRSMEATVGTLYGPASIRWSKDNTGEAEVVVTIPGNVTATLHIEGRAPMTVPPAGLTIHV